MNISTGHYDSKLILLSITLDTHTPDSTLNLSVTSEISDDEVVEMETQSFFSEKSAIEVCSYRMNVLLLKIRSNKLKTKYLLFIGQYSWNC